MVSFYLIWGWVVLSGGTLVVGTLITGTVGGLIGVSWELRFVGFCCGIVSLGLWWVSRVCGWCWVGLAGLVVLGCFGI